MKKNKTTFIEIRKYIKEKGFILSKKQNNYFKDNNLNVLSRTFLSSLVIISFFFVMPTIIQFINEKALLSKEFKNNSKNNFKKTLSGKNINKQSKLDDRQVVQQILDITDIIQILHNNYVDSPFYSNVCKLLKLNTLIRVDRFTFAS